MNTQAPIDEGKILATLETQGLSWRDYFFVGEVELLCFWEPTHWGLMAMIIEDDQLALACKDYVLKRGARRFADDVAVTAAFDPNPLTIKGATPHIATLAPHSRANGPR